QEMRNDDRGEYANHGDSAHTATNEENFQGIALIRRLKRQPVHTRSKFYPVAAPLRQPELRGRRERKQIERLPNEVAETLQELQVRRINQLGYTIDLGCGEKKCIVTGQLLDIFEPGFDRRPRGDTVAIDEHLWYLGEDQILALQ